MSEQENKTYSVIDECHGIRVLFKRPNGTTFETRSEFLDELNALLSRAKEAEADLESTKKMAAHWESRVVRQTQVNELERKLSVERVKEHWESSEAERQLLRRAEKAEAERDELKRKLSNSEDEKLDLVKLAAVDWQRVRIDAAIAAMQALLPDLRELSYSPKWVVQHADALVAELKKEVAE